MQIHELTSRRPTNEASLAGFAKGAAALAGSVVKGVTQQAMQKQGITSPDRYAGQRVAPGQMRGGAAMAANMPALQLMSKKAQEAWTQTQQQLAQKAKVASAALIPTDQLKPHLTALINQLAGFDYNKEISGETAAPEMADAIADARDFINQNVDEILKLTKEKPEQTKQPLEAAWLELVTKGVGPMQTYYQNASSMGRTGGTAAPQQQADPAVQTLLKAMTQAGQAEMQKLIQNRMIPSTKIPALDGLLAQLGAKVQ